MKLILLKNKKISDSITGIMLEEIFAVIRQNQPWPFGLRTKIITHFVVALGRSTTTPFTQLLVE